MGLVLSYRSLEQVMLETLINGLVEQDGDWSRFLTPEDPVEWIETHFRIPETPDRRLVLEPYQKEALREALSRDSNGLFKYSIIVWSDIKKSIKSTIAAAVMLYRAWRTPWGQFTLVANDLKGADSRVGFYIRRAIELNPDMRALCKIVNYKVTLPNRAYIESVAIDPSGEAGGNADMVVFSELWGAHQEAQRRMWTEQTIPPAKFGKAFRWVESYAGFSGESTLLEQIYDSGVLHGRRFDWAGEYSPPLECYTNDSARMFCLWNTEPRMPWQTPEYYASEAAVLEPNEFQRVHRNQWVSSNQSFVPLEWWDACRGEIPPLEPGEPVVIAVDAGIEGDCFAVVMVSGFKDGNYAVRYARAWRPEKGHKVHFRTAESDGPEDDLRRLFDRYYVIEMAYDPYQLADLAERFETERLVNVEPFGQASPRLIADKQLYDMIRDRTIWHSGEADLREHVGNANRKTEGEKLRIVKRAEHLKIDLAVALSMAVDRARAYEL